MKKRPSGITFLSWLILGVSVVNGIRFGAAISAWETLKEYNLRVSPAYVAGTGLLWCLIALPLVWGMRIGKPWARWLSLLGLVGYAAWYWFDRLVFQVPRSNWPFALIVTIIILFISFFILFMPSGRRWFKENWTGPGDIHEQS